MNDSIDLNADLGEDESEEAIARDLAMMDIVSSCNIACGGHAGSSALMKKMLAASKEKAIAAGAHPSYPDRKNFGRTSLAISGIDLERSLQSQLQTIKTAASESVTQLQHVKPHGALYNDAQDRESLADILIELAASEQLPLVGMPQSLLQEKANAAGVQFIAEAFIDRQYTDKSRLVPRNENGAVIEQDAYRLEQGTALAMGKSIMSNKGNAIHVSAQTLCLHSDSSGALETAKLMRKNLEQVGIRIKPVSHGQGG
ncbi:MAG: 5-oxoprolinase subunit PxpA [Parasphingorhabdus sp.]